MRFNSRAREGRDCYALRLAETSGDVSTHAPARGATRVDVQIDFHTTFQLTRPRGARPAARRPFKLCFPRFNSRAREGRDQFSHFWRNTTESFNSRAREGRDAVPGGRASGRSSFNSRAREGRDQDFLAVFRTFSRFNSRAREGRDGGLRLAGSAGHVSTHAPARGATRQRLMVRLIKWFQLTRPRGARRRRGRRGRRAGRFNSRAREGRDFEGMVRIRGWTVSTHAPARGATGERGADALGAAVSTHAPARGAT